MAEELKVIGAGCGRTGTSSLREALKTLGYNPYHMEECVRNDHFRLWLRAGRGDGAALAHGFSWLWRRVAAVLCG